MKSFSRWFRRVLPADHWVVTAVCCVLVIEWTGYIAGPSAEVATLFTRIRLGVLCAAAAFYGAHRIWTFHPSFDTQYRQWLQGTPWTANKPLPMGPLMLVLQDLVIVAGAMLLTRVWDARIFYVPTAFLATYSLMASCVTYFSGNKSLTYAILLLIGFVILTVKHPSGAIVAALAPALLTPLAIRRSLEALPQETLSINFSTEKSTSLGWPFGSLAPNEKTPCIPRIDGVWISLTAGWWLTALFLNVPAEDRPAIMFLVNFPLILVVVTRLNYYVGTHRAPISLRGRIATGRLWQRGYDEAFLAPLAALLLGVITLCLIAKVAEMRIIYLPGGIVLRDIADIPVFVVGVTLVLLTLLVAGPNLRTWRLSGRHRIVYPFASNTTALGSTGENTEFVQTA